MSNYRRANCKGGTYFFTVVIYRRRKILTQPESLAALRESIENVRVKYPFAIDSWVLLPDYLHAIWSLPTGDADFSKRWGMIKAEFTKKTKSIFHKEDWMNGSRSVRSESTIWQRRFWEHQIRSENDFRKHMDYLHYNPVRHGLVAKAKEWPHSTFHRYVKQGVFSEDWGGETAVDGGEFGE